TDVNNEPAGGSTAIGSGLQIAIDGWKMNPNTNKDFDDATLVLLTDGIQNTGPQISKIGGSQNLGLDPACGAGGELDSPFQCGIPIESLAIGVAAEHALIDGISQQNAGISKQPLTDFNLADNMADSLVDALKGTTESLLYRTQDTLTATGGSQLRPIFLDGS